MTPERISNAFHPLAELFDLYEDPGELDNVLDRQVATSCSPAFTGGCATPATRSWTER